MAEQAGGFIWYELMTSDTAAAVAFYGKVVGWDIRDSGMPPEGQYLLFGKGGKDVGGIMAWKSIGMDLPTTWRGHIYTPDVAAEAAAVVRDGGTQHRPVQTMPGVGSFAVVSDPQGAEYLLFQPVHSDEKQWMLPHEVGSVGWHELGTSDWEAAWQFYSTHYSWTKHMTVDMGPMGTYQTFMATETQGGGMMNLPPLLVEKGHKPGWLYYFTVDSIQAAKQRVVDGGGTVTHGPAEVPGGAWILQGVDPQGGAFALTAQS
ncbi:MAG: VOC family protein [Janthinobacterium lividum]